jgi:hypothetical protein
MNPARSGRRQPKLKPRCDRLPHDGVGARPRQLSTDQQIFQDLLTKSKLLVDGT